MSITRIGSIEILRHRVYPLDAETSDHPRHTEVVVEPGTYDLFTDGSDRFWMMRGRLNERGMSKEIGKGLFSMKIGDAPSDIEVVFPSKRMSPPAWTALLADPGFAERFRVTIDDERESA